MGELYGEAEVYGRLFPLDEEELGFWRMLMGDAVAGRVILDVGAGPSEFVRRLGGASAVALDPCRPLLAASPVRQRVLGDALALPMRPGCAGAVVSRLFGIAYAAAGDPSGRLPVLAAEVRRVLGPGGVAVLEVPLCPRPRRLQWIEETAEIAPGLTYRFRYNELAGEHEFGAVLNTEITVEGAGAETWELETPLFVFTPGGARRWAALAGLEQVCFYASYDAATGTLSPPEDALRGVLYGKAAAPGRP